MGSEQCIKILLLNLQHTVKTNYVSFKQNFSCILSSHSLNCIMQNNKAQQIDKQSTAKSSLIACCHLFAL